MFRIRQVHDNLLPRNRAAIAQVEQILRTQFSELSRHDISRVREAFKRPAPYLLHPVLLVAHGANDKVMGFAFLSYFPDIRCCFLDYLSAAKLKTSFGIGGALYQRVREEAMALKVDGLYYECLPDDRRVVQKPDILKQNRIRLSFYERFGARPLISSFHAEPPVTTKDVPPYVVFDGLNHDIKLSRFRVQTVVKTILTRKYMRQCSAQYIRMVIDSFQDDPVRLREPLYHKTEKRVSLPVHISDDKKILLVVNDKHEIHHIKEKGYVESPVRVGTILKEINKTDIFERVAIKAFPDKHLTAVHEPAFIRYLKRISLDVNPRQSVYPYLFPLRNRSRPPLDLIDRAGYYCIDTFTPINRNAWVAARRAVDATLTAAQGIVCGRRLAYALVRPPGHHAERHVFGGFCYLNSAAVAAHFLSAFGKVAILDIDHHHGNGQEDIFYERDDVLTVSLHVHPRFDYPLFTGFADERGRGRGEGYNLNIPLAKYVHGESFRKALRKALRYIRIFRCDFLVVALGLDTAKRDPTGSWRLFSRDFEANGRMIGTLNVPTLVVQEGGYNNRVLGVNARRFFEGLWAEHLNPHRSSRR